MSLSNSDENVERKVELVHRTFERLGIDPSPLTDEVLRKSILENKPEFIIPESKRFGERSLGLSLQFEKFGRHVMLLGYLAMLGEIGSGNEKQQQFSITGNNDFNVFEAFNLLDGRYVNKDITGPDLQMSDVWYKLDFTQKDLSGNYRMRETPGITFDVGKTLKLYPIEDLQNPIFTQKLVNDLKQGGLLEVNLIRHHQRAPILIQAAPDNRGLILIPVQTKKNLQSKHRDQFSVNLGIPFTKEKEEKGSKKGKQDDSNVQHSDVQKSAGIRKR